MNIDLLITKQGEAGLVSDDSFDSAVAGVMFDPRSGQLTLEFGDAEPVDLNIPLAQALGDSLVQTTVIHIGVIKKGVIADNRQVPLVLLDDPFGGGNAGQFAMRPRNSVTAFEYFMKRAVAGQPVHRLDLGDERSSGSVLGGMSAAVLQFAPHLARQKTLEASPQMQYTPQAPSFGPGGAMRGGGDITRKIQRGGGNAGHPPRKPPSDDDDQGQY